MWRRVEVRNYRSIEKVKVDLAPLTLLVGPSGSGKSSFADALVLVKDVADGHAARALELRGGITDLRRWRSTTPTDITVDVRAARVQEALETDYVRHELKLHSNREGKWSFRHELIEGREGGKSRFSIKRSRGEAALEIASPSHPALDRLLQSEATAAVRSLGDMTSAMMVARQFTTMAENAVLRTVRRLRLNLEAMRLPQPSSEDTRLTETGTNMAAAYRGLARADQELVLSNLRRIIPGLLGISVEVFDRFLLLRFTQAQSNGERATFSASAMSDGALRALGIFVAAQQVTPEELLIIEEPEVGLHVGAAPVLFDVLKRASRRGGILVVTHSADLLDAAREEAILVCAYQGGISKIGPLASAQRATSQEGLSSVAKFVHAEQLHLEVGAGPRGERRR
jgi:type I restriction enzyme M protein